MKTYTAVCLALFSVATIAPSAFAIQEEFAAAVQQVRNDTVITHNELIANLKSLETLATQKEGDLRPAFEAFRTGLPVTRAAADRTQKQVVALKELGEKYLGTWQAEIEQIKDNDIRAHALKRVESVRKGLQETGSVLKDAQGMFPALIGYLSDIEKALTYDLTAGGVKSVRSASQSATAQFGKIREKVERAVSELEKVVASLSPTAME